MELKQYLTLLRRWIWLLILGLVLGVGVGYIVSIYTTPIYRASTKFMVVRSPQQSTSELSYVSDYQLTSTYVAWLKTTPVIEAASDKLNYGINAGGISAQTVQNTQIIQVMVEDPDPEHAAAIANTLVEVLVERNDLVQASRYTTTEASLQAQVKQIEEQINSLQGQINLISTESVKEQLTQIENQISILQEEISSLQRDIATLNSYGMLTAEQQQQLTDKQARLAQIQPVLALYQQVYTNLVVLGQPYTSGSNGEDPRISQMQTTLGLYQQIYLALLNNLESVRLARLQNTPNIVQIEAASVPGGPIRPRTMNNLLLGGAIGLMLAAGAAFLIEYLDDTLKTPEDIEQALGLPVLGYIAEMQYAEKGKENLYVAMQPRSPVSEAFRSLRTNLEFAGVEKPLKSILVTSPGPSEGKSTVAVNLAAIIAQGGKNVMLIDADLRRPHIHRFLGISNRMGLSDVFRGITSLETVYRTWDGTKGLTVVTSGSLPPNPSELLSSERMTQVINTLEAQFDVVVIDSPPSLVSDAPVLAAKVDGVLLVVHPGHTHIDAARATLEQVNRSGARMVGVVLNRIPRNRAHYYGGYRYYSPYHKSYHYYSDESKEQKK